MRAVCKAGIADHPTWFINSGNTNQRFRAFLSVPGGAMPTWQFHTRILPCALALPPSASILFGVQITSWFIEGLL